MARSHTHRRKSTGATSASSGPERGGFSELILVATGAGVVFASGVGMIAGSNSSAALIAAVVGLVVGSLVWVKAKDLL